MPFENSDVIRNLSAPLPADRRAVFIVAALTRVLPIYQVYDERHRGVRGHSAGWDALSGMVALPLGRRWATPEKAEQKIAHALSVVANDAEWLENHTEFGVAEEMLQEVMQALLLVFKSWRKIDAELCLQVANSVLEVDSIWAERRDDPITVWVGVEEHFQRLARDLQELAEARPENAIDVYRLVNGRAGREAMSYLERAEALRAK
ncbi:hypothetical protein [Saccharothrix sp. HUAS TT1]|uniref:hypothetical protein n=1 Tax=Saccharothrix sp. HUAS TT1 TaxID=3231910 RepID=UPI00345BD9A8